MHCTHKHSVCYMSRIIMAFVFLLSLIICSNLPEIEARRLHSDGQDEKNFALGAMMNSGPSKGGAGHRRFKHFEIFRVSKDFNPSDPSVEHSEYVIDDGNHN